jgi:murein L,D-transpeptidase YcbB/YkuD
MRRNGHRATGRTRLALLLRAGAIACVAAVQLPVDALRSAPGMPAEPAATAAAAHPRLAPVEIGADVAAFYRDRGFRPLWVSNDGLRPEGERVLRMLGPAAPPGLRAAVAAARDGDPHRLTRADLLLSEAYAAHVRRLQQPPAANGMRYIDPGLAPAVQTVRAILDAAAAAPSLAAHLDAVERVNPVYDGLRRGLAAYREHWSRLPQAALPAHPSPDQLRHRLGLGPRDDLAARLREFQHVHGLAGTGVADEATVTALNRGAAYYEARIAANIERARAISARPDGRYILVDTASARLWMVANGRIHDAMRVVVGKRAMPTPLMAGLIRYAALNPYWNLPPDLIRKRASNAVRHGAGVIAGERLQVLSDWTPQARTLAPARSTGARSPPAGAS